MTEAQTIRAALAILESRLISPKSRMQSPDDVRNYLKIKLAGRKSEVFALMLLDTRHGLIEFRELFQGTIDGATVHAREVVAAVLEANAAAVVIAHNHPSDDAEPSMADRQITDRIAQALDMIDVRVLDHIVVAGTQAVSLAERGWI